jgi:hypothetical protein
MSEMSPELRAVFCKWVSGISDVPVGIDPRFVFFGGHDPRPIVAKLKQWCAEHPIPTK